MGAEVAIALAGIQVIGSVLQAGSQSRAATKAARAGIEEGNLNLANQQKVIAAKAASQKTRFLSSGFTLEGTPMSVIDSTFQTGAEDLALMGENYNTRAKNQVAAGRNAAISSLISGFSGAAMTGAMAYSGGAFGKTGGAPASATTATQNYQMGQTLPWLSKGV